MGESSFPGFRGNFAMKHASQKSLQTILIARYLRGHPTDMIYDAKKMFSWYSDNFFPREFIFLL